MGGPRAIVALSNVRAYRVTLLLIAACAEPTSCRLQFYFSPMVNPLSPDVFFLQKPSAEQDDGETKFGSQWGD